MIDEIGEITPQQQTEQNAQQYLENIGPVDKENVRKLTKSFANTLQAKGIEGFIFAVGGTTTTKNPQERKDIDLLVGVKHELGDTSNLAHIDKYRLEFESWKNTLDETIRPLRESGDIIDYKEESVYPDSERENLAANDGKMVLTFKGGRIIELLCHHETDIKPTAIELFSNQNKPKKA